MHFDMEEHQLPSKNGKITQFIQILKCRKMNVVQERRSQKSSLTDHAEQLIALLEATQLK